ncbi:MAG TPA: hypothetical protein VHE61_23295, partial [Opitutaceae bacterium]|nr:hypothetical protein [Opitutaceae bacterium]
PEFLADILPQMDAQVSAAESCRRWATRNLAEGLFPLAAYHARRATTLRPSLVGFGAATAMAAIRRSRGAERRLAARLYLTGPVRALGIIRS